MDKTRTSDDRHSLDKVNFSSTATMLTQVGEWQAEVRQFFTEDWPRIREMIMELEESEWTHGGSNQETAPVASDPKSSTQNDVRSDTASKSTIPEKKTDNPADPLVSLADRINRKLTAAIASER